MLARTFWHVCQYIKVLSKCDKRRLHLSNEAHILSSLAISLSVHYSYLLENNVVKKTEYCPKMHMHNKHAVQIYEV